MKDKQIDKKQKIELTPIMWTWECPDCGENNETDTNAGDVVCEYCDSEYEI